MATFNLYDLSENSRLREHVTAINRMVYVWFCLAMSVSAFAQSPALNALRIDGTDDFVYPLSPNVSGLSQGTIEFWFSHNGSYATMWCGGNGLPGVTGDWTRFGTHSSVGGDNLAFGIYAGTWRWVSTGTVPESGFWYHVAATWGAEGMKIYLNGTLTGELGYAGGIPNFATELVGASAWGFAFSGTMDEVRIWNVARDSLAIANAFADTLGPAYYTTADSGLLAYYRMDAFEDLDINNDGADDLRDLSVHANHLDSEGSPVLEPSGALFISGINEKTNEIPHAFELHQNFPNPFNPVTVIRYQVNVSGDVELVLYDQLGQHIETLVSSRKNEGLHEAEWDGTNRYGEPVSSGIYFYRLTSGISSEMRKMVLLR